MSFKVLRSADMTQLWHDVTRWHLFKPEVDLYLGIGTNLNNVILEAQSAEYEFNLQEVWLNSQRWTRLTREYLDGPELRDFIKRSRIIYAQKGKTGVVTNMHFRHVERSSRKHKWGNCLLAVTFRGTPNSKVQPTLTLHSRVSYNGYMLGLDMGVAHCLAREIAQGVPSGIRVQWHLDVLQYHSFKGLPYIYTQPDLMKILQDEDLFHQHTYLFPTWKSIGRWWDTVLKYEREGKAVSAELYGPFKRIRRRYEEFQNGIVVPSVSIDDLDFSKVEGYQ